MTAHMSKETHLEIKLLKSFHEHLSGKMSLPYQRQRVPEYVERRVWGPIPNERHPRRLLSSIQLYLLTATRFLENIKKTFF